jgi:hypothetical protein
MAGSLVVSDINGSGFAPTNLVINPEFTINQRGAATRTTTSSAYNFDRWYYDGTNLLQGVENNNLRATTYVLNWEGSSTCGYSLNTAAASGQGSESYTSISKGGTITIASVGSNNLWLKFTSDLGNLNKVMLVQGVETSTFVARPYGTELMLCQRYYQKSYEYSVAPGTAVSADAKSLINAAWSYAAVNSIANGCASFQVTMRASPTATVYDKAGNSGKFSTLSGVGAYTDNVTPNQIIASESNIIAQKYLQSCSGIAYAYTVSAEL